tara:strand:- start:167 stop:433 length:267 start_codon:yes stop_codon:yes gene_type:complete
MTKKVTYMTKDDIVRLNNKAIRLKKNRSIYTRAYKNLKDGVKYPIGMHFPHNDIEVRAEVGYENGTFWLDMDVKDFNKLPTTELPVDA